MMQYILGIFLKSKVSRISTNNIVQRINFANGPVDITYTLTKDQLLLVSSSLA